MKTGRNDPCPCGSGKKYKKCCMNQTQDLSNYKETVKKQGYLQYEPELLAFASQDYMELILERFFKYNDDPELLKLDEEFLMTYHLIWQTLKVPIDKSGETILDRFINKVENQNERHAVIDMLRNLADASPSLFSVKENGNNDTVILEDAWSKEPLTLKILDGEFPDPDSAQFGYVSKYNDDESVFFGGFIEFPIEMVDRVAPLRREFFPDLREKDEMLAQRFPEFLTSLMQLVFCDTFDPELMAPDLTPPQRQVITLFEEHHELTDEETADFIKELWREFCLKVNPQLKKPVNYAAALEYVGSTLSRDRLTQTDLAKKYQTNTGSVSQNYKNLYQTMGPMIRSRTNERFHQLYPMAEQTDFADPEQLIDELMDMLMVPETPADLDLDSPTVSERVAQADQLVLEAVEATGLSRLHKLRKAAEIYPYLPDAYNLAGEYVPLPNKKELYFKGMWIGEKLLGEQYFSDHAGHFWMDIDTKPYMRAKLNYANALKDSGDTGAAILQYREMLKLNPMDNQGIRYLLLPLYFHKNFYLDAKQLIDEFDEASTFFQYGETLLSYVTEGLSKATRSLLKSADKANPFVKEYLLNQKRLPSEEPEAYGWGDRNEAIIGAKYYKKLWTEKPELLDALRKL